MVVKTRNAHMDALIAKVRAVHSYDCPCVVALPIRSAHRRADVFSASGVSKTGGVARRSCPAITPTCLRQRLTSSDR